MDVFGKMCDYYEIETLERFKYRLIILMDMDRRIKDKGIEITEQFQFRLEFLTFVYLGSKRVKNPEKESGEYGDLCGDSHLRTPELYEKRLLNLFNRTVDEIVNACDSQGYIKVTPSLRKTVFAYQVASYNKTKEGNTDRLLFLGGFMYRKVEDNAFVKGDNAYYCTREISFKEYIALGKPKSIEERIVRTISPI